MNGVPLRRVAQAYVIATDTKLDLSSFKLPERLTDNFFKREPKKKKRTEDMFEDSQEVLKLSCLIKHLASYKSQVVHEAFHLPM